MKKSKDEGKGEKSLCKLAFYKDFSIMNMHRVFIFFVIDAKGGIALTDESRIEPQKVKTSKKRSMFAKFVSYVVIAFSVVMLVSVGKEVLMTVQLKQQISRVQEELEELQKENEYLTLQRDKLEDPAYVQSYARGNFMLSKEGEQIFYLPSEDKK